MKKIKLKNCDDYMVVDDEDFEQLSKYVWSKRENGYITSTVVITPHRLLTNAPKGKDVDHINRNILDNRKKNLRIVTKSQNAMNRGKQANNTSGYKGVCWNKEKNKWRACIKVRGTQINLGCFKEKVDAAIAYNEAAKKYHGEFGLLNLIP